MTNETLYYPQYFENSWLDNLVLTDNHHDCTVHDNDGATAEAMGCDGLACHDCLFSAENIRTDISNITIKRWVQDNE